MNRNKKILIVEDNPDIAIALNEVLSDCGHDVIIAPNGKTGIDHLNNHALPDVIILDMYLPVIGGRNSRKGSRKFQRSLLFR
ncbi:MAG: response regulator [Bacteriovoracaceae bacterium]